MSSRSGVDKTLFAAAAAAGLGLFYVYQKRRSHKFAIPGELLASPYSRELRLAAKLALEAGRNMYKYCDDKGTEAELDLTLNFKGQPEDFCTEIDIANEALVMKGIQKEFPEHEIIGEETVGQGSIPKLTSKPTWIIDPVDGTTNFASGLPLTCVSIGYCVNQEPTVGVVYAPMTDELYLGVKGHGAFRNRKRIVPQSADKKLVDSVVCFEFGYVRDKGAVAKLVKVVQKILEHGCRTTRCLGSGVLDLLYVATGRIDVVYAGIAGEGWKPWDYCAGAVIVKEANCCLEAIEGDFDIYSDTIICGVGPTVVKEVRGIILQ